MSFATRSLSLSIQLGANRTFGGGGGNTANFSGLRISAKITNAGGGSYAEMVASIYGLHKSVMNQVSTYGELPGFSQHNDIVTLTASSSDGGTGMVFQGNLTAAFVDFSAMPEVPLVVNGKAAFYHAIAPASPTSYNGSTDVGQILSTLAGQIGVAFENAGVNVKLSNPYFAGTLREQALACVRAAGIEWTIERGTMAIWPKGGTRGDSGAVISPQTGMVGYPAFTATGLMLRTLYNPTFVYGKLVTVDSSLKPASKTWTVTSMTHDLESETRNGQWFTTLEVATPKLIPATS